MSGDTAALAQPQFAAGPYITNIPARLDRLPWSRFHWLVVWALGITWVLDGLEVTLIGAVSGVLQEPDVMNFTPAEIGFIASTYLLGAVSGSLFFGYLTDRWGRKRLFFITLAVYLVGVLLTALSWDMWSFSFFRFMTGAGIGGEYAGHKFGHRRADPGGISRTRGHHHQRKLLDWCRRGLGVNDRSTRSASTAA